MRALRVVVLCAVLAAVVLAETDAADKPKRVPAKAKTAVRTLSPKLFVPKHRIVYVPKGDPRAYPPIPGAPRAVPALPSAFPSAFHPVLKAGAPSTSSACAARKGTCKASSSCTGTVVHGLCAGSAAITCCVPKTAAPTTPAAPAATGDCPVYANAATSSIKGNGGVMYSVVRIAPQHFTGTADNSMTKPTACAFARMAAAAAAAGIRLTINSGFRTYERQVYFWNCFQTKKCNNGNTAAHPGTSNHGRGQALDINTGATSTATYRWMAANASRFGFRRTVSNEPWHWEHAN